MNCNLNSQIRDEKHIMHMYYYILCMYICMQYTERNSLNKNRIYSFTRHRQHLCGHNIVLWTLLFTINTVFTLLRAVHKLCCLKIANFWSPSPLLVIFLLSKSHDTKCKKTVKLKWVFFYKITKKMEMEIFAFCVLIFEQIKI